VELNEAVRRIVGQHWPLILLLVVLGVGAAALLHRGEERTYTASTRLVLDTSDPESSHESQAIADAAKAIATSPAQVRAAIGKAHVAGRDPSEVARDHVSVRALGTSAVMRLSVSDRNPQIAAAISNALAAQVIRTRVSLAKGEVQKVLAGLDQRIAAIDQEISRLDRTGGPEAQRRTGTDRSRRGRTDEATSTQALRTSLVQRRAALEADRISLLSTDAVRPRASIISAATPPRHRNSSRLVPDMILGALLGLVLGLGLAGLLETMRPTVVGGDALARALDTPLLGTLSSAPDDERALAGASPIGERLTLAAGVADVHDVSLLVAGPAVDLGPLSERLGTIFHQAQPALAEVVEGSGSGGERIGAIGGAGGGFRVGPLRAQEPSMNDRRATSLVVVSPEALKSTELASTRHVLRITGFPVLGLITYAPSPWFRRRRRAGAAEARVEP
jgi:uncharacterized protein involved in exopolysaccharide biosynthesis